MSSQDDDGKSRETKSAEFTNSILEFADGLTKKTGKTGFAEYILDEAQHIRKDLEFERQKSGQQRNQQYADELLLLVNQLNETHEKKSKMRRAMNFLDPFFHAIRLYSNVVETLVSSDPTVSALIWGGIKFVVQLAGQYKQYFDDLTYLLKSLEEHLVHLGRLSEIFDWSQHLIGILAKSYKDILLILEAAAEAYCQSGLKTLLKGAVGRLDRKSKPLMARLEANKQSLRDSALSAQLYMTSKLMQGNEEQKINHWLDAPAIDSVYEHCRKNKVPATCDWLFDEVIYLNWEEAKNIGNEERNLDGKNPLVVWIHGPPGIGKTFLASSVIARLQGHGRNVIYYYFRDEKSGNPAQPGKDEALSMLRSLARQLVDIVLRTSANKLPDNFWKIHQTSGGTYLSDMPSAIRVLKLLISLTSRIHIVIDGLDECIDRHTPNPHSNNWKSKSISKRLPSIIEELINANYSGTVKWCFTSCPESDLSMLFRELNASTLEVTGDRIKHDIMTYMTDACDALKVDVEAKEFLQRISLITPNFLDTKLTLELLPRETSGTNPMELLDSFFQSKEGFNARYLRGLSALASKPKKEKELGRRMLIFVATAERPLTKNELLDALAVEPDSNLDPCSHQPKFEIFEELLAPLLELDTSINYANPTVRFIHRTAREFMRQDPQDIENLPDRCREFFPDADRKNLEFGKVCLAYLTHGCFGRRPQAAILDDKDEECHSFLRYASIFWHQHLDFKPSPETKDYFQNIVFPDLFRRISSFMRSRNFLTCLCVQGKYAPYLIARFTKEDEMGGMQIDKPNAVFAQNSTSELYYGDPIPEWVAKFNSEDGKRLARGCYLLIKEFGLVLLRRRGGIGKCYSCLLGAMNFLPPEDEVNRKVACLENVQVDGSATHAENQKHFLSFHFTPLEVTVSTITIQQDMQPATLIIEEWKARLSSKKNKALKFHSQRKAVLELPQDFIQNVPDLQLDVIGTQENDCLLISLGSRKLDLMKANLGTGDIVAAGFGTPEQHMSSRLGKETYYAFHGQNSIATEAVSAVSYRWSAILGPEPHSRQDKYSKSRRADTYADSDSDSDSDVDSDDSYFGSHSASSGSYTSGSATSITAGHQKMPTWHTSIGLKQADNECRWYDFDVAGPALRQSAPYLHPTKPFVLLPLDGVRTAIIDYLTGECRELNCSNEKQVVGREYYFSGAKEKLFELVTTREQGSRWTIHLNTVTFDVDQNNDLSTISIYQKEVSSVSWIPPYSTPYENPDHATLPYTTTWTDKHVYLVFGAVEVYLVRMLLNPCDDKQESSEARANEVLLASSTEAELPPKHALRVETTKEPAFLPASTTERSFRYIPYETGDAYGIFAITGSTELPPVLIRQDIKEDLGGWMEHDTSTNIGGDGNDEDQDMKGRYSSKACSFEVTVRSGLSWDVRLALRCV